MIDPAGLARAACVRTGPSGRVWLTIACCVLLGALGSCGEDGDGGGVAREPLEVLRVFPAPSEPRGAARLLLNQQITIYFNRAVDPMSVTPDTVRVVDRNGNRVRGRLWTSERSVTFEPVPPVDPTLGDGSFRVDRSYRLEVVGLPLWNAIRDAEGQHLARGFETAFRTVPAEPSALGFATPFLPTGSLDEPFMPLPQDLQVAATSGRMEIHFNAPILPGSVSDRAIRVEPLDGRADESRRPIVPIDVRILPEARSPRMHFGSTLELRFDPADLGHAGLCLMVFNTGEDGLRDYLGRPLSGVASVYQVYVTPDDRIELLSWGGRDDQEGWGPDQDRADGTLGLRILEDGGLEPSCLVEAGAGELGVFRPKTSMTLRPGVPFDRGDGVEVVGRDDGDFRFERIEIPAGVTVRVEAPDPEARICVRAVEDARVDGSLVLDTPMSRYPWRGASESMSFRAVQQRSGCTIVVGGTLRVDGSIEHVRAAERGSPLSMFAGGPIVVRGTVPAEVVLELGDRAFEGTIESPILVVGGDSREDSVATRGLAPSSRPRVAERWTSWRRLPAPFGGGSVSVRADGVRRGDFTLEAQTAPPHSVDPTRPETAQHRLRQPTPVDDGSLILDPGTFVRFRMRTTVSPQIGDDLPSIARIRVLAE